MLREIKAFFGFGEWRVLYPDGKWSLPMNRNAAENYAGIFGGSVFPSFIYEDIRRAGV